ncbi:hypothetical protein [Streptomyces marincola]|uniref:hypothetical protein n=1 Tax=Streptomyces marincola TaxID=2878388 RepID=UPI001CF2E13F|nr:hypothetical protein [Streptomyces marincola]UCM90930.1 hypothetical protein LC193_24960 [Streptomyces marincola]
MSAPVDAEQAWRDLQRIRVPQERVYDEFERHGTGGRRTTYATAAIMWLFLVGMGLDLPLWGVWLGCAVYTGLLAALAVRHHRASRLLLHHSRRTGRMFATFAAGGVLVAGTVLLSGRLAEPLAPLPAGVLQATVTAGVFVLFAGPAERWSAASVRGRGAAAVRGRAV